MGVCGLDAIRMVLLICLDEKRKGNLAFGPLDIFWGFRVLFFHWVLFFLSVLKGPRRNCSNKCLASELCGVVSGTGSENLMENFFGEHPVTSLSGIGKNGLGYFPLAPGGA